MNLCVIIVIVLFLLSVVLSFTNQPRAIEFALWAILFTLLCGAKLAF